ncbi:hypothetical protein I3760_06G017200 [Carya illinoinensis]|nr:hypothetical protein I3760_06G017200 [Carya illinoinensis]
MKLEPPSSSHHRAAQLLRVTSPTVPLFFLGFMHYKRRCKIRAPCSKGMSGLLTQEMLVALLCSGMQCSGGGGGGGLDHHIWWKGQR